MANSGYALFHGIPALYAPLPPRQRQRRTATNIMAGCFDSLPALASDSGRDDSSSSQGSIMTVTEDEDIPERVLAGPARGKTAGRKPLASEKGQKRIAIKRASESMAGKGKQVRRVVPEEKENAVSDSDSGASLSPFPPSAAHMSLPPTDLRENKPKASGFWRARSSNTPEGSSSALKRKVSSIFNDDSPSPPPSSRHTKKSRPANSVYSDILSSESLTSLESQDESSDKTYAEKLIEAVGPHVNPAPALLNDWSNVWCKLCPRFEKIRIGPDFSLVRKHFHDFHPEVITHLGDPPISEQRQNSQTASAPVKGYRQRGPRKNVAVKKGWKGWVEEDLEPQKLILLDKPEVLPERTTRSGRKID